MPTPLDQVEKIGAGRTYEDGNDAALTGTYKDPAAALTPEQKSVFVNLPMTPGKTPYTIKG